MTDADDHNVSTFEHLTRDGARFGRADFSRQLFVLWPP
jgi:hypothetical protein